MSVLTRTRRINASCDTSNLTDSVPAVPAARREAEAPERAACPREAPESRPGRATEAPDAGVGHPHFTDTEFTRGRSQS